MKELRERKHFEKLKAKQTHNYDHLEYESVKIASAFKNNFSQWIVQKKAEVSSARSHEIYLHSGDSNEKHDNFKADVHVILHSMIQTRDNTITQEFNRLKEITINEQLKCVFRKWDDSEQKYITLSCFTSKCK